MADVNSHAYNTAWQFRADAWCRLEEASERLSIAATRGRDLAPFIGLVDALLTQLRPFERYWAFPGIHVFGQMQRLFTTGSYDKFGRTVAKINRALISESYRTETPASPLEGESEALTDTLGRHRPTRPYFELLVVATMTEAQERVLANEIRSWRRPDDAFIYEVDLTAQSVTSRLMDLHTITPFDSLIVAAGAQQSYFGNDQFATYAPTAPRWTAPAG
jgi:arginine decarboxylase